MPLDPSISLNVRVPQVDPYDPTKTLLTIAQLKQMQEQSALRELQAQDLRLGINEYGRVQEILAQQRAGAGQAPSGGMPPMAPGASPSMLEGQAIPPGGAMPPGAAMGQAGMVPPALPGANYAQDPRQAPGAAMQQLSPGAQAPPGTSYGMAPNPLQPPALRPPVPGAGMPLPGGMPPAPVGAGMPPRISSLTDEQRLAAEQLRRTGMPQVPGQGPQAPQGPQALQGPQRPQAPGQQSGAQQGAGATMHQSFEMPSMQQMQQNIQKYQQIASAGPRVGIPMAKEMAALDAQELEMRMKAQTLQLQGMKAASEALAGVTDQASYDEARSVLASMGSPLARQLPASYDDPQAKGLIAYHTTVAQTQQQRVEAQIAQQKNNIEMFNAHVNLIGKQTEIAKLPFEQQKAMADFMRGQAALGQVAVSQQEAATKQQAEERLGREVMVHSTGMGDVAISKYGTPMQLPGAPTGAPGVSTLGPSKEAMAPARAAMTKRLEESQKRADVAQEVHIALNEAERLIEEGVYPQSPTLATALKTYDYTGKVPLSYDGPTLDRTKRLRELGAQLTLTNGTLGSGVSAEDARIYQRATGNFESGKTLGSMQESITSMRRIADQHVNNANELARTFQQTGGQLPPYQGSGTSGTARPIIPRAKVVEWAQKYGITEQEAAQRAQASGYQLGR